MICMGTYVERLKGGPKQERLTTGATDTDEMENRLTAVFSVDALSSLFRKNV